MELPLIKVPESTVALTRRASESDTKVIEFLEMKSLSFDHSLPSPQVLEVELQPEDIAYTPGKKVELFITTNMTDCTYQWYLKDEAITTANADYEGSTTAVLCINNCLSKHEGAYKCIVTDPAGRSVASKEANIEIGTSDDLNFHAFICMYLMTEPLSHIFWYTHIHQQMGH